MYSHSHKVVDNTAPLPEGLIFFPQYLQENGYKTAFFGKWHMGNDSGAPQPGFDHWEGFKGQGEYYNPVLIQMENGFSIKTVPMLRIC